MQVIKHIYFLEAFTIKIIALFNDRVKYFLAQIGNFKVMPKYPRPSLKQDSPIQVTEPLISSNATGQCREEIQACLLLAIGEGALNGGQDGLDGALEQGTITRQIDQADFRPAPSQADTPTWGIGGEIKGSARGEADLGVPDWLSFSSIMREDYQTYFLAAGSVE
jgi:hypothetical protein